MLRDQSLVAAKGVLASLMEIAYVRRVRVGLMQFAGQGVREIGPPQRAPKQVCGWLAGILGGGGTPLRQGLETAIRVLERERKRFPREQQTLILLTDGRSRDALDGIQIPCRTLVIDTERGPIRLGRCRQLASALNAEYLALDSLPLCQGSG
jgi:Mg-chelatase subunit ChlD